MDNWYERSFGEDYIRVYKHRDRQGAADEVRSMVGWLKLPVGSRILDLCCGAGRHAIPLAKAGYRVTGVDLSPVLLREGRNADKGRKITWVQSDMRRLPEDVIFSGHFDAVTNLFTSFGYFEEDEEQIKVLGQMKRALKPDGRFVMDLLNDGYVRKYLVPHSTREIDGIIITENRRIEHGFVFKEIDIQEGNAPARKYRERVKLYPLSMMINMLEESGLIVDQVYGDYEESRYEERESPRMIMVGHSR
ncbi:class I SAM-dependent methyltransferase [Paenibacillus caui]|uniref:class I SAM-dependent methyltransferase n=1 Tax=Paenibacillus caui TaxID=2873927 RepID=UPI001CA999EB|nr:class I SAM-dependent methyltransferase [Paenibacillus caui]